MLAKVYKKLAFNGFLPKPRGLYTLEILKNVVINSALIITLSNVMDRNCKQKGYNIRKTIAVYKQRGYLYFT